MAVYTSGRWKVAPGHEDEFVAAWRDLARQTQQDFPGSSAMLLQDRDDPILFLSFGPWESIDQIEQWRASQTFQRGVAKIRALLDDFTAHTLDPAASV